jgi:hypothetical protein
MIMVTEEQVRVDSVRKTREEYLRERMRERNLSDLFVDLKIRTSRDDHYWDLKKATIQAIRRRVKQAPITEETFDNVSFGSVQVCMERWQGSIGYHSPMRVLQHLTKAPDSELKQYGIKAIVTGGLDAFTEGYGSLRHDIPPKKHKRKFGWKPDFYTMIDIPTFLAEVLFTNALIRFAMENVDLIIREFAKAAIEYVRSHRVEESQLSVPSLSWLPLMEQMERLCPNITVSQGDKVIHLDQKIPAPLWEALLNQDEPALSETIRGYQARDVLFQAALFPLLHEVQFLQDDADDREELESTHVRVWQLKKNIPKKVIARMEKNAFLSHYGVVELDADVGAMRS